LHRGILGTARRRRIIVAMPVPVVAIVGRPNVGKSSLLNALARERIAIVDPRAGITRDRVSAIVAHRERYLEFVDTGGVGLVDADHLEAHVEQQIRVAIERADAIVFVVDVEAGLTPLDRLVADRLRPTGKPVVLVANKVDDPRHEADTAAFHRLGFGDPLPVSALHARGRAELLERILAVLPAAPTEPPAEPIMKLAIVGKRNAGKSTLVNALAGEERMIVSEIPGTTRDAVDVRFERDGQVFVAIDTAGVRKKARMTDIDFYSYTRALRSIQRADVVLLLIDAEVPVAEADLKLAAAILEEYKPVVVTITKWDLAAERATPEQYQTYLTQAAPALRYAPVICISARTGLNVDEAIRTALRLHAQARTRVPTADLNAALRAILTQRTPSARRGTRPVKIYYATQIATAPPTLVFFCNEPDLIGENYRRYLENRLHEHLPFREVPLRLWFRRHRPRAVE